MNKYIKYFKYIVKHKWYVMLECFKFGLFYRGIIHDFSKFLPSEFFPYANYFYGDKKTKDIKNKFNVAVDLHYKRNKHHWQYWIVDDKPKHMDQIYIYEMVCDWLAMDIIKNGKSRIVSNFNGVKKWYSENKDKMNLHQNTRNMIEYLISY